MLLKFKSIGEFAVVKDELHSESISFLNQLLKCHVESLKNRYLKWVSSFSLKSRFEGFYEINLEFYKKFIYICISICDISILHIDLYCEGLQLF